MKRAFSLWLGVIAGVVLLVLAFLVVPLGRGFRTPNLPETILTGGVVGAVVGAIVGFVGVLVAQYLTGKRHNETLQHARELEAQRAQEAARLEAQRTQEASLQKYFEQMGNLLVDPERPLHRSRLGDSLSTLARAPTLSIVAGLDDPTRKRIMLQSLYESGLIHKDRPIVSLNGAYLREVALPRAYLFRAYLREANLQEADLQEADLREANLQKAYLQGANFQGAYLQEADLREANLQKAYLQGARLWGAALQRADLREANLQKAYLQGANFQGAYLQGTDLRGAYLRGAWFLTQDQINWAIGDEMTTLPDGLDRPSAWSKPTDEQPNGDE